ncbi:MULTISPECIES: DoxX family protein [Corynebacterium]|uniref:DoxX family protein n=1 Tax=Corynebacterium TaxID=1716 RepID=UPI001EF70133|nr:MULTISPECIES: DoxX family protein [Corynebacterium]MCG7236778.1 DoxX family protein [Corynebacterium sp. ACRQP]MCG7273667.1 DoxX family protein [Corynebacterium afermentans]
MNRPAVRDFALLVLRLVLGAVFVAHGYNHWFEMGMAETGRQFAALGVPQPQLSAYLTGTVELIGGAFLAVGLLTTITASLLALLALAAGYFVHLDNGFFIEAGGVEYTLVLAAALFIITVFGTGRVSLDGVLTRG